MPIMILNSSRSVYICSGVGRFESMRCLALKLRIRYLQVVSITNFSEPILYSRLLENRFLVDGTDSLRSQLLGVGNQFLRSFHLRF